MADINTYKALKETSKSRGEHRDCGVVALALSCQIPYDVAHAALKAKGRKDRKGTYVSLQFLPALEVFGFTSERLFGEGVRQKNGSRYTSKTIGKLLSNGCYVCVTTDHMFAVVDGLVLDWSRTKRLTVNTIYKITKAAV